MARIGWLIVGFLIAILVFFIGGYIFITEGGVPMATSSAPLPLEQTVAGLALTASDRTAADDKNPLPFDEGNMVEGASIYRDHCLVCHGAPGQPASSIAKGMFPNPPQLFAPTQMVTDDPEGITHWKVTNGIRLSGMPAFAGTLSDTQRWQVTLLVAHADKPPDGARALLAPAPVR